MINVYNKCVVVIICVVEMMFVSFLFASVVLSTDKTKMMKQNHKRNQHNMNEEIHIIKCIINLQYEGILRTKEEFSHCIDARYGLRNDMIEHK